MSAVAANYQTVHDAYEAQRPAYAALAELVGRELEGRLQALGLEVVVLWRAKSLLSFVKKALREGYTDPLVEVGDKAGIRVIVHYLDDVQIVERVVGDMCLIHSRESKLDAMAYDALGYLGVHLDIEPRDAIAAESTEVSVEGLHAELQIHTKAQSAWAVISHDLLYKPPIDLPLEVKRGAVRLVALAELFDAEVRRLRQTVRDDPHYRELMIIEKLDDHIIRFTEQRPDRALSALSVPALAGLYGIDPERVVSERIEPFLAEHEDKLNAIYRRYRDDTRANPLLFQPEALLVFERLENDIDRVRAAWPIDVLPVDLLDNLALVWGADLGRHEGE